MAVIVMLELQTVKCLVRGYGILGILCFMLFFPLLFVNGTKSPGTHIKQAHSQWPKHDKLRVHLGVYGMQERQKLCLDEQF